MSVSTLFGLAPVHIDTAAIGGITAADNGFDSEFSEEPSSGELTARIQALVAQKFRPTFTTMDLAAALAACGSLGGSLATKALHTYARKYAAGGTRAASGHVKYTYQHGLLLPVSIDCNHQGDAALSYQAVVTWDGVHGPLVIAAGATLPTITADPRWTLGAVILGGATIPQIKSVRVDFGINAESEGADSDVWDTHPSVSAVQPKFSVTSSRIAELLPLIGQTGAASLIFRRRADGGTFSGQTLTLSGSGMASFTQPFSASGNAPGEATIEARLKYDGVNDPITIALSA